MAEEVPEVSANVHPTGTFQRMFIRMLTEAYFHSFLEEWDNLCDDYNRFAGVSG